MPEDAVFRTLSMIREDICSLSTKVDKLDDKMVERIGRVTESFHVHELGIEGRLTKIEVKSGLIATLVSAVVAGIAALIGFVK